MATTKLTPRQKMINMMYLVLIAMLALNVSREILKSFYLFELSYINANDNTEKRNIEMFNTFKTKMENPKSKARTEEWYKLAEQTRKVSADFCQYVEQVKKDIIKNGGGRDEENPSNSKVPELKRPDDMEEHAHYFIDDGLGNGKILQEKINTTRNTLIALVKSTRNGEQIAKRLEQSTQFKALDPKSTALDKSTWVSQYLENAPLASVVTLLTKTQHDCKLLEAEILNILSENINISTLTNDQQMAMIIPEQQTVMSGESFKAKVALVTYDSKTANSMFVNGNPIQVVNGVGSITIPATGTGAHKVEAQIESIDPETGNPIMVKSIPIVWNSFQASATISADNMNVLFFGLENPMSISVPGVTPENTIVTSNNGISLKSLGGGKYTATVTGTAKEGKVFVKARMQDGSIKDMGAMNYKLRKVPKPKIKYGSYDPGTYTQTEILAQRTIYAYLEDFYFNGVRYNITKYKVTSWSTKSMNSATATVNGNSTDPIKNIVKSTKSGDLLYFDEIRANGPNGEIKLEGFTIKIK